MSSLYHKRASAVDYQLHVITLPQESVILEVTLCDNYRVSGALEKLEHETILQDRASDR